MLRLKLLKPIHQRIFGFPVRNFPRVIHKEQQFLKESKYRFREVDPETAQRYKNVDTRKQKELLREADRLYSRFDRDAAAQDPEFEKDIDRLIDQKLLEGLDDSRIIEEIVGGGNVQHTLTNKDIREMEQQKEDELREIIKRQNKGKMPDFNAKQEMLDGGEFENFQQKAGKMMYETDQILLDKWVAEEKERRTKEREETKSTGIKRQNDPLLKVMRKKRSIEPGSKFAHAVDTADIKELGPEKKDQNLQKQFHPDENEDYSLDSHIDSISEKELDKAFSKQQKSRNQEGRDMKALLKKEIQMADKLSAKDKDFMALAQEDEKQNAIDQGYFQQEEKNIVGRQARTQYEDISKEETKKLTTKQKIERELRYVTESLALTPAESKHWYYRIKREYEEEERIKKKLQQKQARKDFIKLMKDYKLPKVLEEEEDFEKLYDQEEQVKKSESEEPLPAYYKNEREYAFYGDDINFLRFHKRTTRNVHDTLQGLIDSAKQTVYQGIKQNYKIAISHLTLNKSTSLVTAYWHTNRMNSGVMIEEGVLRAEAVLRSQEIQKFREGIIEKTKAKMREEELDEQQYERQLNKIIEQLDDLAVLNQMEQSQTSKVEAELQKRLTKAAPYLSGKLCQSLGLRYSPEIRFYKDNSLDIYSKYQEQAQKYMDQAQEAKTNEEYPGVPKELLELRVKMQQLSKMDKYQIQTAAMHTKTPGERKALEQLLEEDGFKKVQQGIELQIQSYIDQARKEENKQSETKKTRRDLRADKEMQKLKDKINLAGNTNFDEMSQGPLNPQEMEESLVQFAGELTPTKHDIDKPRSKKYSVDIKTGEKQRIIKDNKGKFKKEKVEKNKERSLAFWDKL